MKGALQRTLFSPWTALFLLIVLFAAAAATWFLATHEKKSYTITSGASPQARRNPLLAAHLFLREIGHESESLKGLELFVDLPSADDAILIRRLPGGMSEKLMADLLLWVSRGGHLLVVPSSVKSDHPGHTSLLERMGAGFVEKQSDCGCPPKDSTASTSEQHGNPAEGEGASQVDAAADSPEPQTPKTAKTAKTSPQGPFHAILHASIGGYPLELETFRPRLLKDLSDQAIFSLDGSYVIDYELEADRTRSDQGTLKERQGAWLLQYGLGSGKVTFLSEMKLFSNPQIGNYDHAFFLSWLTREDEKIWLIYATGVESILTIIWKYVPQFWITLAVTIILLIWKLQLQSGTRRRTEPTGSRSVLDHIDATAQYSWRTERLASMLKANRKAILTLWSRRSMGTSTDSADDNRDLALLAERCGLSHKEVHAAFHSTAETEEAIIKTSRTLQRIRQLITDGVK